ncbi:MAG: hypothetical protein IH884_12045, partial [Myxococcales bacterium]|nr:hypothetical protein [Myxococcales bacterium]
MWRQAGVSRFLTNEQETLIGCGRFWGTDCEADGFDLSNAEDSALFQSWPRYPGTEGMALDFAEDGTRTNWGVELVWFKDQRFLDNGSADA